VRSPQRIELPLEPLTADAGRALSYLKRFGSVTVLNGHIHQIIQKVEGNVSFHTAASTAFPQPAPGTAPAPGPMKEVPAGEASTAVTRPRLLSSITTPPWQSKGSFLRSPRVRLRVDGTAKPIPPSPTRPTRRPRGSRVSRHSGGSLLPPATAGVRAQPGSGDEFPGLPLNPHAGVAAPGFALTLRSLIVAFNCKRLLGGRMRAHHRIAKSTGCCFAAAVGSPFQGDPRHRLRLQSVRPVLAGVYPPPILKPTILKGRERRRGARPRHIPLPTEEGIF
jgi:hypothetical protein